MSHYDVLGVDQTASQPTIRKAYLGLARRHHPDRGGGGDGQRMAVINEAWAVLGDDVRRAAYDQTLDPIVTTRPEAPPWKPYDDGDEPEPMPAEDTAPPTPAQRAVTLAPAILFALAVGAFAAGLVTGFAPMLALGGLALIGSGASFVLAPVITMFRSLQNDPDR